MRPSDLTFCEPAGTSVQVQGCVAYSEFREQYAEDGSLCHERRMGPDNLPLADDDTLAAIGKLLIR